MIWIQWIKTIESIIHVLFMFNFVVSFWVYWASTRIVLKQISSEDGQRTVKLSRNNSAAIIFDIEPNRRSWTGGLNSLLLRGVLIFEVWMIGRTEHSADNNVLDNPFRCLSHFTFEFHNFSMNKFLPEETFKYLSMRRKFITIPPVLKYRFSARKKYYVTAVSETTTHIQTSIYSTYKQNMR